MWVHDVGTCLVLFCLLGRILAGSINYFTMNRLPEKIKTILDQCPEIASTYDLAFRSVQGRPLQVLMLSANHTEVNEKLKPMVKLIANMHGNEATGFPILYELARYLCHRHLEGNQDINWILDHTQIHILLSLNPDGYEKAVRNAWESELKQKFYSVEDMLYEHGVPDWMVGRNNANDVNINRNFPDLDQIYFNISSKQGRYDHFIRETFRLLNNGTDAEGRQYQPETLAATVWILKNPFVLSANLHNGGSVVNYPFDDSPQHTISYSRTADDKIFRYISYRFALDSGKVDRHGSDGCGFEVFPNGITNGAAWYPVQGGMQDFNYLASNCFEITIELHCKKFPPGKELDNMWKNSKPALLAFIQQAHLGIKGKVVDQNGIGIDGARISVTDSHKRNFHPEDIHSIMTAADGYYWRLLLPGSYLVEASKTGYNIEWQPVKIHNLRKNAEAERVNFILSK